MSPNHHPRTRPARRSAAALGAALAIGCLAGAASPSTGSVPSPASELDSIPAAVRAMIHPTTTHLPPFPNENPELLDAAHWAATARDSGMVCALELRAYVRGVAVPLQSVRKRKEGQSFSARYLCSAPGWRRPRYAGPFYVWAPDGAMVERSYRVTDGSRYREDLYQYRGIGLIWAFRHREGNEDESGATLTLDEYFGPDGRLAGFLLERTGPDSTSVAWLRGARVDAVEFRKWALTFPSK